MNSSSRSGECFLFIILPFLIWDAKNTNQENIMLASFCVSQGYKYWNRRKYLCQTLALVWKTSVIRVNKLIDSRIKSQLNWIQTNKSKENLQSEKWQKQTKNKEDVFELLLIYFFLIFILYCEKLCENWH